MVHGGEALLDSYTGGLEDDDAGERKVPHEGASHHPRLLVCAIHCRRQVHHDPVVVILWWWWWCGDGGVMVILRLCGGGLRMVRVEL